MWVLNHHGEDGMINLNALLIAERQRQIRVETAPRCCGSPARPRASRDLRRPRRFAWRAAPAACC
jgi:hypothetical protein